jgi:hypothetical protein
MSNSCISKRKSKLHAGRLSHKKRGRWETRPQCQSPDSPDPPVTSSQPTTPRQEPVKVEDIIPDVVARLKRFRATQEAVLDGIISRLEQIRDLANLVQKASQENDPPPRASMYA